MTFIPAQNQGTGTAKSKKADEQAYFDSDVNVNITEVVFRTEDGDTVLDGTLLDDEPIEMIAD